MTSNGSHRVGRGGVGNIVSQQTTQKLDELVPKDLEAQDSSDPLGRSSSDAPPPKYSHTGRGGAGNWYSPEKLIESGRFVADLNPTAAGEGQRKSSYTGRGGVGNYIAADAERKLLEKRAATKAVEEARTRKENVAREVEAELKVPEQAYLSTERPFGE
ncbi:hypothetical protein MMC19_001844 [Ptychographa xylographoides]|nr:hypothetical protein [Ptychographa xylographoides]